MYKTRFLVLAGMVLAAAAARLIIPMPNVSPVAAVALFSGACFESRHAALFVPLAAMFMSDVLFGMMRGDLSQGLHSLVPVVYGSFALIVCLGFWLRRRRYAVLPIASATLAGSVLFFVLTNFGVWTQGVLYPRTWEGLIACYTAAIPFFQHTLLGNAVFAAVLFGGLALLERNFPSLRGPAYAVDPAGTPSALH